MLQTPNNPPSSDQPLPNSPHLINNRAAIGLALVVIAVIGLTTAWYLFAGLSGSVSQTPIVSQPSEPISPAFLAPEQATALTQDSLFTNTAIKDGYDPDKLWTMVVTGDIIPARGVDNRVRRSGPDYPFAGPGIIELLQSGDLTIADLEAPVLDNCPVHNEGFTFCGQSSFAAAMAKAGINLVSVENNHVGNYGQAGRDETNQHLTQAKIAYSTATTPSISTVKGIKVGMLSFNGVTSSLGILDQDAEAKIKQLKKDVDLVLVSVHWGKEYALLPTDAPGIAPEDPLDVGPKLIDAGADMVVGNHPHWAQGIEMYKGKPIAYAYGNFIFDQSWSTETTQGFVARYTYYDTVLVKAEFFPTQIYDQAQPRLVEGEAAKNIMDQVKQSTQQILAKRAGQASVSD